MSYTSIIHFDASGDGHEAATIRNSHGWGPQVWKRVFERYLSEAYTYLGRCAERAWALHDDPRLTKSDRVLMRCTFDNVVIRGEDLERVAGLLDEAHASHLPSTAGEVWHAGEVARLLRVAAKEGVRAVGFNGTSCADLPLLGMSGDDDHVPYNLDRDDDHWYLVVDEDGGS